MIHLKDRPMCWPGETTYSERQLRRERHMRTQSILRASDVQKTEATT